MSLALVLHNHQPVGNFGWVIAEAYERAYEPLIAALERHRHVRLALHYSGPLLDWLGAERPAFLERVGRLVAEDRVELLGGGYYEPVLAALPERDRLAQLVRMADAIERIGGHRPRGAWLAERVWEPDLPVSLVDSGYRWTVLDDAHLRAASVDERRLWGTFMTDDQGRLLTVFASNKGLRYRMPFGTVDDTIAYLRDQATDEGGRLGLMGDDGEKFGSWPETFEHCWGTGRWMDRFFSALAENAAWLELVTPSEWAERERPIGRAYIPTSSYAEMGEWALPADESLAFETALVRAERDHLPEARWLRGGFWRNFQVKYREINELHKQMLRTSAKVARVDELASGAYPQLRGAVELARTELLQGQSNDCYWHGVFGGIYITHMRLATYAHLIAAEDLADAAGRAAQLSVDEAAQTDTDLDGVAEILVTSPGQVVVVDPVHGAGIGSWDIRPVRHALAAVLRRRREAYHGRLLEADTTAAGPSNHGLDGAGAGPEGGSVPSIHDIVRAREPGLAAHLHYDAYERRGGLVHLLAPDTTATAFAEGRAEELGDAHDGAYDLIRLGNDALVLSREVRLKQAGAVVRIEKRFTFDGSRRSPAITLDVTVEHAGGAEVGADLAIEWPLMMLGGGGNPAAYYLIGGERTPHDGRGERSGITGLTSGNEFIGIELATSIHPAATVWWSPIETISNSEFGFERVYQGSALVAVWPIRLGPGERVVVRLDQRVTTDRDRSIAG
jgi:alpha-amylase